MLPTGGAGTTWLHTDPTFFWSPIDYPVLASVLSAVATDTVLNHCAYPAAAEQEVGRGWVLDSMVDIGRCIQWYSKVELGPGCWWGRKEEMQLFKWCNRLLPHVQSERDSCSRDSWPFRRKRFGPRSEISPRCILSSGCPQSATAVGIIAIFLDRRRCTCSF